jgi:hypothetical protein
MLTTTLLAHKNRLLCVVVCDGLLNIKMSGPIPSSSVFLVTINIFIHRLISLTCLIYLFLVFFVSSVIDMIITWFYYMNNTWLSYEKNRNCLLFVINGFHPLCWGYYASCAPKLIFTFLWLIFLILCCVFCFVCLRFCLLWPMLPVSLDYSFSIAEITKHLILK